MTDLTSARWRKSTRSSGQGDCVEVATNLAEVVGIRDSKDPNGAILAVSTSDWKAFVAGLRQH